MKKKNYIIILSLLFLAMNILKINAVVGNATFTNKTSATVGDTFVLFLSYNASEDSVYDMSVSVDKPSVLRLNTNPVWTADSSGQKDFSFTALSPGTVTVTMTGSVSPLTNPNEVQSFTATRTLTISNPTVTPPTNPNNPKPTDPPIVKQPEEEPEVKKDLIKTIGIVSKSEKMNGELLKTIETQPGVLEYEYLMPKGIDSFGINAEGAFNDVEIAHDETYTFKADENEMLVNIVSNASGVSETYIIKVKRTLSVEYSVDINDKSLNIYDDEKVATFLSQLGFEQEFVSIDNKEIPVFRLGDVKLQLFVDEEKNAHWLQLNGTKFDKEIVVVIDKNNKPFFITKAPEELSKQTIKEKKYIEHEYKADDRFKAISEDIKFDAKYFAWNYEANELVYGFRSDNVVETTYLYDRNDIDFTRVILEISEKDESIDEIIYIVIIGVLTAIILGTYITLFVKKKKKSKRSPYSREENEVTIEEVDNSSEQ